MCANFEEYVVVKKFIFNAGIKVFWYSSEI